MLYYLANLMSRVPFEWDEDIHRLGERFDDFFDRVFELASAPRYVLHHGWRPATDVYEVADGFVVVVELAGVEEKNLSITLENRRLRIAGSRPLPAGCDGKQPLQLEIEQGPFERQIALPADADAEGVKARFDRGLLLVHIPLRAREPSVKVPIREEL
jgi:HSP20 family protein